MATANAGAFGGTNEKLNRGADYTGNANSKQWSFAIWALYDAGGATNSKVLAFTDNRFYEILKNGSEIVVVQAEETGGSLILDVNSGANTLTQDTWECIMGSFDMADTGKRHLYFGDTDVLSVSTYTDDTIDFTQPEHHLFGRSSIRQWSGDGSIFWMNFGQYIDFSVESNRRIFYSSNGIVPAALASSTNGNVGGLGQPLVFLNSPFGSYQNNLGSGGGLTEAGTITAATGPEVEPANVIFKRRREYVGAF